jgi:hypothetical protein
MTTPAATEPARLQTYAEFWPFYLQEHRKKATRVFHYIGTTGVLVLFLSALINLSLLDLVLMPVCGYGWAWVSHFFIEKNRPATFKYPGWSLGSDFRMYALALTGQLGRHLDAAGVKH